MKIALRKALHDSLGLPEDQLNRLILRSPYSYKVYTIPKRSGGLRVIAQPAKETKFLQHWLMANVFRNLPVHECATAYQAGSSIKKNAELHKNNSYLVKLDFKNFFPSISARDLISHMRRHLDGSLDEEAQRDIARISCIRLPDAPGLCLSIGAPSSPMLSNSVMFEFDTAVHGWCNERGVRYSRYADDLSFSTNERGASGDIKEYVLSVVERLEYPRLSLNDKKSVFLSKKHQRRITGLIINNENQISLGRDRKREISALIHKFSVGALPDSEIFRLQGLLGFARDVEPRFFVSMSKKYTSDTISNILSTRKKP
ncbi:RNA-directed DNA polymerase [Cupriavidus necator]|uniref:RNA-directed DNA polymerase n=1 Tax=Cupriavidus necator TaxID=106590 RepID=A0A2P1DUY4_CUPNE|nr:retron St85 family RNA-directed DNA polymerase [Cupriavidus necator]AVK72212.1 RNA-directed DNA polymerase [Cupriavidus necator]